MDYLKLQGLTISKSEDKTQKLLQEITLTVNTGEIVALLGSSGSGKSLTCSGIMDVTPKGVVKVRGDVYFNDRLLNMEHERGRLVSIIMQNPSNAFNPLYTMKSHMKEVLKVRGCKYDHIDTIQSLIEAGISEPERVLELYPFQMSGGMLQRVMIAMALLSDSKFILADEPTTDLDLIVQEGILRTIKELVAKKEMGILMVTHDLGVIAKIADKVVVIDKGILVEEATITDFFNSPKHAVSRSLIDAHLSLYEEEVFETTVVCK